MRFVCSFWIICLCCCFAQERSPFESRLEPVELSLSLHCSEWLGTLHSTTLGISTIFSIVLCLITSSSSSFPAVGYALLPELAVLFYFSWVLGSLSWLFFRLSPSMPALPVRDIGAAVPAGTAHVVVRPCFQGLPDQRLSRRPCDRAPWSCSAIEGRVADQANLLSAVVCCTSATSDSTSAVVTAFLDLVPRGQRALLDQFRTV